MSHQRRRRTFRSIEATARDLGDFDDQEMAAAMILLFPVMNRNSHDEMAATLRLPAEVASRVVRQLYRTGVWASEGGGTILRYDWLQAIENGQHEHAVMAFACQVLTATGVLWVDTTGDELRYQLAEGRAADVERMTLDIEAELVRALYLDV